MTEKVLNAIENLVESIYCQECDKVHEMFLQLADAFMVFINEVSAIGYTINIDEEVRALQQAYIKKDYVELADVLLYMVKPQFEALQLEEK